MREAAETAKLRLFLKLVAVVDPDPRDANFGLEPLPDIDFNIRSGNTLVGFATQAEIEKAFAGEFGFNQDKLNVILEDCKTLAAKFAMFQNVQLTEGADGQSAKKIKVEVQRHLDLLREKLNGYLALVYGIETANETNSRELNKGISAHSRNSRLYYEWLHSHQPFHWFAEFYRIIAAQGGFDVVIGNPPYVELRQISYTVKGLASIDSAAVHAMCIERAFRLVNEAGNVSMIVPLALVCTQRMIPLQHIIENNRAVWYANFAWRPGKLFDTVNRALTIYIANHSKTKCCYNTDYMKWNADTRDLLFDDIHYVQYNETRNSFWSPKLSSECEVLILQKMLSKKRSISDYITPSKTEYKLYYRTTGGLYWKIFTDKPPKFLLNGKSGSSSRETSISFKDKSYPRQFVALFSSSLFWWWYTVTSNLRDLNPSDLSGFKFNDELLKTNSLDNISNIYIADIEKNSTMLTRLQKNVGETQTQSFKISKSKLIIDEIDKVLAKHYGFTDEELDFIINYDIKYRMGGELEEEE
jgi:hypothetical protein